MGRTLDAYNNAREARLKRLDLQQQGQDQKQTLAEKGYNQDGSIIPNSVADQNQHLYKQTIEFAKATDERLESFRREALRDRAITALDIGARTGNMAKALSHLQRDKLFPVLMPNAASFQNINLDDPDDIELLDYAGFTDNVRKKPGVETPLKQNLVKWFDSKENEWKVTSLETIGSMVGAKKHMNQIQYENHTKTIASFNAALEGKDIVSDGGSPENRTANYRNSASATGIRYKAEELFGPDLENYDWRNANHVKALKEMNSQIEEFTGVKSPDSEFKFQANLARIAKMGDILHEELSTDDTGVLIDVLQNNKVLFSQNIRGVKARSAYFILASVIRKEFYGAALSPNEEKAFKKQLQTLGVKAAPVYISIATTLRSYLAESKQRQKKMNPITAKVNYGEIDAKLEKAIHSLSVQAHRLDGTLDQYMKRYNSEQRKKTEKRKKLVPTQEFLSGGPAPTLENDFEVKSQDWEQDTLNKHFPNTSTVAVGRGRGSVYGARD